jgi:hypothetical protein
VKRLPLLLSLFLITACAGSPPVIKKTGVLPAGATIVIHNAQGDIDAYAPERSQPADEYTIAAYASSNSLAPDVKTQGLLIRADAASPGVRFLVRGPKGGAMDLSTQKGNINVADFEGIVNAHTGNGDIKMLIPMYGNASIGTGNMSVIYASTDWPGTLHFSTVNGNVELYVNQNAKAKVRLHTDDGNIFSDFPGLRGTSQGNNETIQSFINGGGPRSIDVEVKTGSIRLMQLKPQI